ncbi:hypothetical protein K432DRAFT_275114, partial [Lepidopterella palustris CBS 459.81]
DNDPFLFRLQMAGLDEAPHYKCNSYVWADPINTMDASYDGRILSITKNLWDALQHVRNGIVSRYLGADASCIDQENLEERGSQVQMMRAI